MNSDDVGKQIFQTIEDRFGDYGFDAFDQVIQELVRSTVRAASSMYGQTSAELRQAARTELFLLSERVAALPSQNLIPAMEAASDDIESILQGAIGRIECDAEKAITAAKEKVFDRPSDRRIRESVFGLTNGVCIYCDANLNVETFHVEHVVPKSRGGPDAIENFVPSCSTCNSEKHARHVVEFIRNRRTKLRVLEGDAA
jgi:hypothetical protein